MLDSLVWRPLQLLLLPLLLRTTRLCHDPFAHFVPSLSSHPQPGGRHLGIPVCESQVGGAGKCE